MIVLVVVGESGYIVSTDIQRMISLGYESTNMKYLDNDIIVGDINVLYAFKPNGKLSDVLSSSSP